MNKKYKDPSITINKVYTKTGDQGKTRLAGGKEVSKKNVRVVSYGEVDELNSSISIIVEIIKSSYKGQEKFDGINLLLVQIQNKLFNVGTMIATLPEDIAIDTPQVSENDVKFLEEKIDFYNNENNPLKSFVIPGGNLVNSYIHLSRTICRRAERNCVALLETEDVPNIVVVYLNRLSDLLFVLSRVAVKYCDDEENLWNPNS